MDQEIWAAEQKHLDYALLVIRRLLNQLDAYIVRLEKNTYDQLKYQWRDLPQLVRSYDDLVLYSTEFNHLMEQDMQTNENRKRRRILEKMEQTPYFGRIDFKPDHGEAETVYIGLSNVMNETDYTSVVCDWRAPIASLFYENGKGRTAYDSPDGPVPGEVTLLRQYVIENQQLKSVVEAQLKIDDSILIDALSNVSSEKMKTVVNTIQREQNEVIRDSQNALLLVLGPAGSGKTSVALHRVAYMLYRDRKQLHPQHILIFAPNDAFARYISEVIPELGEDEIMTTTFADMIRKYIGGQVTEMYEQAEYFATAPDSPESQCRRAGIRIKGSMEMLEFFRAFVAEYKPEFEELAFQGVTLYPAYMMQQLYSQRYAHMAPSDRLAEIRSTLLALLEPVEKKHQEEMLAELAKQGFSTTDSHVYIKAKRAFKDDAQKMLAALDKNTLPDYTEIYRQAMQRLIQDTRTITEAERRLLRADTKTIGASGVIRFEDGMGILLLKVLFGAVPAVRQIRHVVIDEIQDYAPAQHEIFNRVFPNSRFTLLGDTNQMINTGMGMTDSTAIAQIYRREPAKIRTLQKSYRSTAEINAFAHACLHETQEAFYLNRHGAPVTAETAASRAEAVRRICAHIQAVQEEPGTTAVITKTLYEARRMYQMLKPHIPNLTLADDDQFRYEHGRCVIPLFLAKGMEFDRVVLADSHAYGTADGRLLYTACTRAMHRLHLVAVGAHAPAIPIAIIKEAEEAGTNV